MRRDRRIPAEADRVIHTSTRLDVSRLWMDVGRVALPRHLGLIGPPTPTCGVVQAPCFHHPPTFRRRMPRRVAALRARAIRPTSFAPTVGLCPAVRFPTGRQRTKRPSARMPRSVRSPTRRVDPCRPRARPSSVARGREPTQIPNLRGGPHVPVPHRHLP